MYHPLSHVHTELEKLLPSTPDRVGLLMLRQLSDLPQEVQAVLVPLRTDY